MRIRLIASFALVLAACFSPDYGNGMSQCGPAGECPDGYSCAADNHCYQNGTQPDLSVVDAEEPDLLGADLSTCSATQHACSGACVDNSSVATCGTACTPCPLPANGFGTTCDSTSCGFTCNTGFHVCGDSCSDNTSVNSCGVSCTPCAAVTNATAGCTSGSCSYTCNAGFRLCGGNCISDPTPCGSFCGPGRHLCSSMCLLDTDVNSCGTGCSPCATPTNGHGVAACNGGNCAINCDVGYHLCGTQCVADTDPTFGCGAPSCAQCGTPDGGIASCVPVADGGGLLACNAGCATPAVLCGAVCSITASDVTNCGGCNMACSTNHISAACSGSACTGTCSLGFADCNSDKRTDGCERNIRTLTDCNACGTPCSPSNASGATCASGACTYGSCNSGFADCNTSTADGCETSTTTITNCGNCGQACSTQNIAASCTGGNSCESGVCAAGFLDCDNNKRSNGCEINKNTNVMHCGTCSTVCSPANATGTFCNSGNCDYGACSGTFQDCNGSRADGCESNKSTDVAHCGNCNPCSNMNIATPTCVSGVCSGTCNGGFADCNGNKQTDGCEINTTNNASNCGSCGHGCNAPTGGTAGCASSLCAGTCSGGQVVCGGGGNGGGACKSLTTDPDNCGACGTICSSSNMMTRTCGASACNGSCNPGFADCNTNKQTDGCEINTTNDPMNCGSCGHVCNAPTGGTATCVGGACTGSCSGGQVVCGGGPSGGGACKSLTTDPDNCGACGTVCSNSHMMTRTCAGSICNGTCATGFADCNGNKQTDGCEINTTIDTANCGSCSHSCSAPTGGSAGCSSSLCAGTCTGGQVVCGGGGSGGGACKSLTTDPDNCGGCGTVCSNTNMLTRTCAASNCNGTCAVGFADCNSNKQTDGCEINTTIDTANCGSCTHSCSAPTGGSAGCSSSLCAGTCTGGQVVCGGGGSGGGACKSLTTDADNCGGCGTVCSSNNMLTRTCGGSSCNGTCSTGFADCNINKQTDGCEINITNNAANCGSCGHSCSAPTGGTAGCSSSACAGTCSGSEVVCSGGVDGGGTCVDEVTDPGNCGSCGHVCSAPIGGTAGCGLSLCQGSCSGGESVCGANGSGGGTCVNEVTDANNCGSCAHVCTAPTGGTAGCALSNCAGTCTGSEVVCGGGVDGGGTCVNTTTDANNCASCGHICAPPTGGTATCSASTCAGTCTTADQTVCGGGPDGGGTCFDTQNDPMHCGASCVVCPVAMPTCTAGTCT